jgi:predicted RNA-binding Zn ribbon-like protein
MRGKYKMNSHLFKHFKKPDVIGPAAFALSSFVNGYLKKAVSIELNVDPSSFEFKTTLQYQSLGAALVSEAIEFMAGHFEAKQCKVCGSWFRVGVSRNRRDRIFCSAACKMRDFRARQ